MASTPIADARCGSNAGQFLGNSWESEGAARWRPLWFTDPAPVIEGFAREAARCVALGAEALIPTCGVLNQVLRENQVRGVGGCPILDGSSVLLKLTEAMVDLRRAR